MASDLDHLVLINSVIIYSEELRNKLAELRNTCLIILAVANVIWLVIIVSVMDQDSLKLFGSSALSLVFLGLYTVLLLLQFLALIFHR